jgi:uncharacterized protein
MVEKEKPPLAASGDAPPESATPDWHEAVRRAMQEATEQEILNRYGSPYVSFNYRWEHVTAVAGLADRLAELTGADRDIVEAAAWLHDVRKETRQQHAIEGAAFARSFLPKTDFPPQKIEAVAQAIEDHMGLWRDEPLTNLEAKVLWDADKLSKIGLTAVFHWTGGSLAGSKMTNVRSLLSDSRQADWQEKAVASMHTEPARRAARIRLDHFNWLWRALEEELNGDDLQPGFLQEE